MKAVILAAGKSTRTHPVTVTRPKALVKIGNKPLLQYNLESLDGKVDEVVLVVGFMKEMIKQRFGSGFRGMKLSYVEQKEQLGTAHALLAAEPQLDGDFLVLMGDDIYGKGATGKMCREGYAVLAQRIENPSRFGVWIARNGRVNGFAEKPAGAVSNLVNCGMYKLDTGVFDCIRKLEKSKRGEYELNEAVNALAKEKEVRVVDSGNEWVSVGYPWDILGANEAILDSIESEIKGVVEPNATIKGRVRIGRGSIIRNGSYIEGPVVIGENCVIGPNCFIRGKTSIGDNCRVGNAVEIKNCVIGDRTNVGHLTYLGDCVAGDDVNIGAGNITANLRHDNKNISTMVKGVMVDTGRRKFGAVIGDRVHTGINTSFYPGRKLWPGQTTLPGEIVKKDKM